MASITGEIKESSNGIVYDKRNWPCSAKLFFF